MLTYVYRVTNKLNGKVYIGISVNPKKRLTNHLSSRGKYETLFSRALRKYGLDTFKLEVISGPFTRDEACSEEILQIAKHKSNTRGFGYNQTIGGEDPPSSKGLKRSDLTKRKMSEAQKGKRRTEEQRRKLRLSRKGYQNRKGTSTSAEARLRMSRARQGVKLKEETKKAISKAQKDRWGDPSYRLAMRDKLVIGKRAKNSLSTTVEDRILQAVQVKATPISEVRAKVKAKTERFYAAMNHLLNQGKVIRKRVRTSVYLHAV